MYKNELEQAVDLAFKMNNKKEHYSTTRKKIICTIFKYNGNK